MSIFRDKRIRIFITVLLIYSFYIAPAYLTANTNRYMLLTKSIVDDNTFNIDKDYLHTRDRSFHNEHYYISCAPGLSFMAVPIYLGIKPLLKLIPDANITGFGELNFNILNFFFTFFLSVIPGALLSVLFYDLLSEFKLKEKERMLMTFTLSFGTLIFFYSTKFMAHTISALALFSSFYIFFKLKNKPKSNLSYFLAGLCLGLAVLLEYVLFVLFGIILLYALSNFKTTKLKNYISLGFGILFVMLIYMYYHYVCFDNPFSGGFAHSYMYASKPFSIPSIKLIYEMSIGTYRGMFTYMPILLVSLYGIYAFFRSFNPKYLKEIIFISVSSLVIFLLISGYIAWDAGGSFGQRYFICILPFLMIPIAFAFKRLNYKIIAALAGLSVFINWCGVQYGDADSVFTNIGLFVFGGVNSNLAEWAYTLTNQYVRELNVLTRFSPFIGLVGLLAVIYLIWKKDIVRG